ncbi:MAG: hypothetical protein KKA61_00985, partial [Nanoarchaeota archaeon]|nr:hypothetical protein [Nanoarchaeota archaeon]
MDEIRKRRLEKEIKDIEAFNWIKEVRKKEWLDSEPGNDNNPYFKNNYNFLSIAFGDNYHRLEPLEYDSEEKKFLNFLHIDLINAASSEIKETDRLDLFKSNLTSDYKVEIAFNKPQDFENNTFKETIEDKIVNKNYIYNSQASLINIGDNGNYVVVNLKLTLPHILRMANLYDF